MLPWAVILRARHPGKWLRETGRARPLGLQDSEVVSPPALVADERWVILPWENARVPRSGQASVGWVQSVAFKFRVPYVGGRVVHVCHLQEVFGASVLVHFNGFSAPLLRARVLGVLGVWGHLEVPTFEDEFTYVIFTLSAAGNNECDAQDEQEAAPCRSDHHSDELIGVSTVETTEAKWAAHTGFIFKPISIFTCSARVIHLVELKVARLALTQRDAIQVGADGGLFVTFRTLPLTQAARSKDPPLRPQELADFSRGPAGVDIFLDPVSQVK